MKSAFLIFFVIIIATNVQAQQWQEITPDGYTHFRAGYFINKNEGWLLANSVPFGSYDLLHTTDGGQNFEPIFTFPEHLISEGLQMTDSLNGYATVYNSAGYGKYFWKTMDGGHTWNDITDTAMFKIGGPLYASFDSHFTGKDTGFAGGLKSICKTSDGGISWAKMNIPEIIDSLSMNEYLVNKIFFTDEKFGWAACAIDMSNGFVLKTTDGGLNWTKCTPMVGALSNIHFADSLHGGTVSSSYKYVLLTNDNFDTLSHLYSWNWAQYPYSVYYQNNSTIWMSGSPAIIYKSIDGGDTFVEYDTTFATGDMSDIIHDFQFFGNTGYAFSYTFLLKMVDTLNTPVLHADRSIDNIEVTPNPFSDHCKVRFTLSKPESLDIVIISATGVLVTKTTKWFESGNNEFILDIKDLNPGLYMVSIKSKSENHTVKLIKQP